MKTVSSYLFVFSLLMLNSCSKSPACWGDDKDKGQIEKYFQMKDVPVSIQYMLQDSGSLVAHDTTELIAKLGDYFFMNDDKIKTFYRSVDFYNYSLLGFYATGQCEVKFIREVSINDETKTCHYSITRHQCGMCKSMRTEANLILVPKLSKDYKVEFDYVE